MTAAPLRTEAELIDELTEVIFREKMLRFELARLRDPMHRPASDGDGADVEREVAELRARSLAKLEASL
jgi:hypothetical protein